MPGFFFELPGERPHGVLPGMYADGETGLIYGGSRYYDPRLGRWITADRRSIAEHVRLWRERMGQPGEPPLELTSYAYVAGNPLRWIDIDGFGAARSKSGARNKGGKGPKDLPEVAKDDLAEAVAKGTEDLVSNWFVIPPKITLWPCLKWECNDGNQCRPDYTTAVAEGLNSGIKCRCVEYDKARIE